MEKGKSSNPGSKIPQNANPSPDKAGNSRPERQVRQPLEQDLQLPMANVIRIMRKVLPVNAKISEDVKETIQMCISEYISFVTSEANDIRKNDKRKTLTAEDVLAAFVHLGFDDYVDPLISYLARYRFETKGSSSQQGESSTLNMSAADGGPAIEPPPALVAPSYGPELELPLSPTAFAYGPLFPICPDLSTGSFNVTGLDGLYEAGSSSRGAGSADAGDSSQAEYDSAEFDILEYLRN